ncbi:MAG: hypothetical protein ACREOM_07360 [Candidatus Dormibacteraceae bacterium]
MSTEFSDTATTVQEIAVGAAKAAAEVASDPMGSARKQVKGFERKGAPTVRRINRRFNARINALVPEKVTVWGLKVDGELPEKIAIKGLHLVKLQARRHDVVGDVAKRTLRIFHSSFKTIARTATRFEVASSLTAHRPAAAKPAIRTSRRRRRRTVRRAA